jgi:hypothetical protein
MSRRGRHGRHGHPTALRPAAPSTAGPGPDRAPGAVDARPTDARPIEPRPAGPRPPGDEPPASRPVTEALPRPGVAQVHGGNGTQPGPMPSTVAVAPVPEQAGQPGGFDGARSTCTTAQLRRFIKSRPWVPMHELRRRFGIWGADDDVSPMRVGDLTLFIGLPAMESRMMAELLSGGDVGYELSLDPGAPIVVGVYPMRPVPRS